MRRPQQRPTPTAPSTANVPKAPVAGQIVVQDANTVLAKELIGQTVYAPDKTKIGAGFPERPQLLGIERQVLQFRGDDGARKAEFDGAAL